MDLYDVEWRLKMFEPHSQALLMPVSSVDDRVEERSGLIELMITLPLPA